MRRLLILLCTTSLAGACASPSPAVAPEPEDPQPTLPRTAPAEQPPGDPGAGSLRTPPDLSVVNTLRTPTRVALGPQGRIYVTDVKVGSVFILGGNRQVTAELKGLRRPLGVAVDAQGRIYVGDEGRRAIEVFSAAGVRLRRIGEGELQMPNDLALDGQGNLYVADSRAHVVRSYRPDGTPRFTIGGPGQGDGSFQFPATVALSAGATPELYVGDQGQARIQVFGLDGSFRRAFGQPVSAFGAEWRGRFQRIQSLALDGAGNLHVCDTGLATIQVLDPQDGRYLRHYGERGTQPGQLGLPLDLVLPTDDVAVVANAVSHRVDAVAAAPAPQAGR